MVLLELIQVFLPGNPAQLKHFEFNLGFVSGNEQRQGTLWEGFATGVQLTIKVPHSFAAAYHDAGYLVQPLLLAISAASPFVESRATRYDSTRIHVLPQSVYGFSQEEKDRGRPGRLRALEFSLTNSNGNVPVDERTLMVLSAIGVQKPRSRITHCCFHLSSAPRVFSYNDSSL